MVQKMVQSQAHLHHLPPKKTSAVRRGRGTAGWWQCLPCSGGQEAAGVTDAQAQRQEQNLRIALYKQT